ncbi:nicotinate (nicotinamide) nucleotide adenylyltransferase [Parapusillimonas granuli]|uniref:Probable nicotinate-nucleotide adenylyltransferase n=1 Tax=Parapusillimonas granuli TaxID=380911 RepID=A0A853FVR1_9BURK|nr:nicotinate (nicotinamide) nucleotide adenylyltransferase [Parapusillimonas granuli]MBB5217463.1 nicotinate-nucleotide adenylyltransferase [Parapusillimonas granuli]MEB2401758.1 nicotinate (nicotinamide) nucleotide adenylyltransferase [Alcaligenaceae bacterium]NYT50045.1 nicotinate (nicotinamide) nucleotide adenylyltransferase [Parapusillimonas granuli]
MAIKIGLLGGSFDPVHLAHIDLAETAWRALELARVELIPAADPWQRGALAASGAHRLAMLRIAVRGRPHMAVNDIEIRRGGKTYTVDTLRQLPTGPEYYWILGSDQLGNFCSWHAWQEIARLATLAVAHRGAAPQAPPALQAHLETLGRRLEILPFKPQTISSTQVRERLARGQSTSGMLDAEVADYIRRHGLYSAAAV